MPPGVMLRRIILPLAEAFTADEAFVTGTLAGITPVNRLDGRRFDLNENPVTRRITGWYQDYLQRSESPPADHRRTKRTRRDSAG
jgi:branched-chain amino acid aminotransferase